MLLGIQQDSPVPIYEQIVSQVVFGIAAGLRTPGESLTSVRALADQLIVNPNTVARAYQELERMGVVESRRGLGMEVTAAAPALCRERRREIVQGRIRAALREAAASALSPDEIRRLVEDELARVNGRKRG